MPGVLPQCLSLVLCDSVERLRGERVSLLGVFQTVSAPSFPMVMRPFRVWIELANGHGVTPMKLIVSRMTPDDVDGRLLVPVRFTVTFRDPRTVFRHEARLGNLELEAAGDYRFRVAARDCPIAERYLRARLSNSEEGAAT